MRCPTAHHQTKFRRSSPSALSPLLPLPPLSRPLPFPFAFSFPLPSFTSGNQKGRFGSHKPIENNLFKHLPLGSATCVSWELPVSLVPFGPFPLFPPLPFPLSLLAVGGKISSGPEGRGWPASLARQIVELGWPDQALTCAREISLTCTFTHLRTETHRIHSRAHRHCQQ